MDALRRVVELADSSRRRKRICVLEAVDIKNTFNSLSFENKILLKAEAKGMSRKLLCLLGRYLEDRKIVVRNSGGTVKKNVYADVPQSPIL